MVLYRLAVNVCGTLQEHHQHVIRLTRSILGIALVVVWPAAVQTAQGAGGAGRYGLPEPLPRRRGTIRLASYNVLNLFDHDDDPDLAGGVDDIKLAVSHERGLKLAEAIRAVDADVVALQEVESLEALRWFRESYLPKAGYVHLVSLDVGDHRGIECSVMSRFEITAQKIWRPTSLDLDDIHRRGSGWAPVPERFRRGLEMRRSPLMVDLRTPAGYELTIVVVHHKAGRDFAFQREAEALRVIELIMDRARRDPGRNIVVMGDFNAAPWDKSLRVYLEAGLIDTLAHRATRGEAGRAFKTHESNRILDYVLLNSAAHRELVIGTAHIYGTLVPPTDYDWRNDPYPTGYASDHYPVIIDLVPVDQP